MAINLPDGYEIRALLPIAAPLTRAGISHYVVAAFNRQTGLGLTAFTPRPDGPDISDVRYYGSTPEEHGFEDGEWPAVWAAAVAAGHHTIGNWSGYPAFVAARRACPAPANGPRGQNVCGWHSDPASDAGMCPTHARG